MSTATNEVRLGAQQHTSFPNYFSGSMDEISISSGIRNVALDWSNGTYEKELIVDANTIALYHFNESTACLWLPRAFRAL